ncbi:MAG: bifunctional alpha,alpha-trehalose-phosphate synthase (UDP-forming)/trehalose-phosphatase [Bacteroidales bacterium]|nr:bifunctional alpha,alpha-trehalose-phosphate synthase (UDP-forming)/trehalose-phosphatase [Bacteroidales bacterium]MCF8391004.1 bifunctional alpha,alpha-trehalose-phosphate synthase (UDP-forming)/trehalose-phosphatase [Bacteroidales bacterium]
MSRIFFVSNLLPLKVSVNEQNRVTLENRIGGFSSGLTNFYKENSSAWLGTTGLCDKNLNSNQKIEVEKELEKRDCYTLCLKKKDRSRFLDGYANKTIWPVFHYFQEIATYKNDDWKSYVKVNQKYADRLAELIRPDDKIWIHDYHLMLLPKMLREKFPDLSIGYFQHIPFPSFEIFRMIPHRIEILEGLLGADLIGFHTYDYERHFLSSVRRLLGLETYFNQIRYEKRVLKADNFPMGIDYEKYNNKALELINATPPELKEFKNQIETHIRRQPENKIILSIDWLDYSKGLLNRILSFKIFLKNYPEMHGKVTLLLFVTPPNESISEYKKIKSQLDEQVGTINSEYGRIDWTPIHYLYTELSFDELVQVFLCSDVALITPTRDGMNLIAKEYVASRPGKMGVLILSELAGAAKELGEALIVNPNSHAEIADSIYRALTMEEAEVFEMNSALQKRLSTYTESKWAKDFISSLESVKKLQAFNLTKKLNISLSSIIKKAYDKSEKRIIFLDYDGTLQGFFKNPQDAKPDEDLYKIINKLASDQQNHIIIISGRDKETLTEWFRGIDHLNFIAEHGVWYREDNDEWQMMDAIDKEWMKIIRPTLEFYVDRTPRSFIETKNYSLVWHYRKADPDLGLQRSLELKDELQSLVTNLNLEIMDGDNVIEIKNAGINKGRASLSRMGNQEFDFILAIGDDWTDEFTFNAMPEKAYTIKVGNKPTRANYYVENFNNVREFLLTLIE